MSPAMIEALVILGMKYGPALVLGIEKIWTKKDPSMTEFADLFRDLKPYEAYGIPDQAPVLPVV